MNIALLREKIKTYRQLSGHSQKELAVALGLHPVVLSHKLNATGRYLLNHNEVKQIIFTLAQWDALSNQAQVVELLELGGMRANVFSDADWNAPPLNRLEAVERQPLSLATAYAGATQKEKSGYKLPVAQVAQQNEQTYAPLEDYPPHNLPNQPTALIGRKKELNRVCNLLRRADVRLVTLTGPGGVGKTRLGLGVAFELLQDFGAGVHYVPLAALTDEKQLADVLVRSFGLQAASSASDDKQLLQLLKTHLDNKHLLLVLDNLEQLLTTTFSHATELIAELLAATPNLKIMTTSRMLLRLYGEHEFSVPPLDLPKLESNQPLEVDKIAHYEAVELFVARARAANHAFRLTDENCPVVIALCQRLDALPLAIELAAARVKMFPPAVILERITASFDFLKSDLHNRPARHQTLRATLDWSYKLLDEDEKLLFRALAIFRGGFSLEAVEAICTRLPGSSPDFEMIEVLEGLVSKSLVSPLLVVSEDAANPKTIRFGMLESIREGALAYLQAQKDLLETLYQRYIEYYRVIAEAGVPKISGPEQVAWLDELETEYANVTATLKLTLEAEPGQSSSTGLDYHFLLENGLRLAAALRSMWFYRGYWQEARKWIDLSLNRIKYYTQVTTRNEVFIKAVADAYYSAGLWDHQQIKYAAARVHYEQALPLYREIGNKKWMAAILNNLGYMCFREGDYSKARTLLIESKELFEELGEFRGQANVLDYLAQISSWEKNRVQARQFYEEALMMARRAEVKLSLGVVLINFGGFLVEEGAYDQAESYLMESLELMQELRHKKNIAILFGVLGALSCRRQDYLKARQQLVESIKMCLELDHKISVVDSLLELVKMFIAEEKLEQATLLLTTAHTLHKSLGTALSPSVDKEYKTTLSHLQERLTVNTFQKLWEEASRLPLEEVLRRCDINLF